MRGLLSEVSKADPKSWLLFYNRYNIRPDDVDLENALRRAYIQHGKVFSEDLNRMLVQYAPKIAAFTGEDARNIIDSVFDMLGINGSKTPEAQEAQKAAEEAEQKAAEEAEAAEQRKKKLIIGGFIGLVAAVIVVFVSIRIFKN
ncbi:MAG: hypothetical protein LBM68_06985 [Bacteroidales bacterium]|jgi:hypothetical protein|nr:hypothetical protein [Bacteroidales bacterium]